MPELRRNDIKEARKRIGIRSESVGGVYYWSWGNSEPPEKAWKDKFRGRSGRMNEKESTIEKHLVNGVKRLGGIAYKFVSPGNNGVPDRIVVLPKGSLVFVELKTDTGKLSKLQEMQIDRLRRMGQSVYVLFGMGEVEIFLELIGRWIYER